MKRSPSLSGFQTDHARFLELFIAHQCALMAMDLEGARLALDLVIFEIGVHADVEDEVLMPIFIERVGRVEGGGPELFQAEHDKIVRLLEKLSVSLDELMQVGTATLRGALALIEMGFTFKHLWDHHTQREDKVFYPVLDQLMSGKAGVREREAVWKRMDAAAIAARKRRGPEPRPYHVG